MMEHRGVLPYVHDIEMKTSESLPYDVRLLTPQTMDKLYAARIVQMYPEIDVDPEGFEVDELAATLLHMKSKQPFSIEYETTGGIRMLDQTGEVLFGEDDHTIGVTDRLNRMIIRRQMQDGLSNDQIISLARGLHKSSKLGMNDVYFRFNKENPDTVEFDLCLGTAVRHGSSYVPLVHRVSYDSHGPKGMRKDMFKAYQAGELNGDMIHSLWQYTIVASMKDAFTYEGTS